MRVFVMAGLLGAALVTPAAACPQGARCIAMPTSPSSFSSIRETGRPAPARPISLQMRVTTVETTADHHASLRRSLTSYHPQAIQAGAVEVPEIWATIAAEARSRLPRHANRDVSLVVSPVVVTMPSESTPGLGVSGEF